MLRRTVNEFVRHYHEELDLQALGNRLIKLEDGVGKITGELCCQEGSGFASLRSCACPQFLLIPSLDLNLVAVPIFGQDELGSRTGFS